MVEDDRSKTFGCVNCGETFTANPPDDYHQIASLEKDMIENPIEMKHVCKNCNMVTILYWGEQPVNIEGF